MLNGSYNFFECTSIISVNAPVSAQGSIPLVKYLIEENILGNKKQLEAETVVGHHKIKINWWAIVH